MTIVYGILGTLTSKFLATLSFYVYLSPNPLILFSLHIYLLCLLPIGLNLVVFPSQRSNWEKLYVLNLSRNILQRDPVLHERLWNWVLLMQLFPVAFCILMSLTDFAVSPALWIIYYPKDNSPPPAHPPCAEAVGVW